MKPVLHEGGVSLILVDLVADVVDVDREVVLSMEMDDVTDVGEHQTLFLTVLQGHQKTNGGEDLQRSKVILISIKGFINTTKQWGRNTFIYIIQQNPPHAADSSHHSFLTLTPHCFSQVPLFSHPSIPPSLSPLADLQDSQDIGEESLPVPDDQHLLQLPGFQEVFIENT